MLKRILKLTGKNRNAHNNITLGIILAFIAGSINAGGFSIVDNYTSHVTGMMSSAAAHISVKEYLNAFLVLSYISCFVFGATFTAIITLTAQRHHLNSQYAIALTLESIIIMALSLVWIFSDIKIPYFIASLCFLMGLQNALITKASSAIIRTTHISGMATDLGIEIGKYIFLKKDSEIASNLIDAKRHMIIILSFFAGGIVGAISVNFIGIYTFFALATLLFTISMPTVFKDLIIHIKIFKHD